MWIGRPLSLALDALNALLGTRALQPTEENLGGTGIRGRALSQTALDLRVTRGLALTAGCRGSLNPTSANAARVCSGSLRKSGWCSYGPLGSAGSWPS
jgi:hypothetical protein